MSPLEHVDDYPEIPISLASTRTTLKTGAWRSVRPIRVERAAPCTAACPAGVPVPHYLHLVGVERLDEALQQFMEANPFPRITGRVCPHPCEGACNLTPSAGDDPVSIRAIERWLGDATAARPHPAPHRATGKRVAVVGSGPAGLAAAYFLRRSGHEVTVFERRERPGGMLRHAIPGYRLPAEVVDDEVERLAAMGVVFRTGVEMGVDIGLDDLEADHAAVFLATGAAVERPVGIPGEDLLVPGLEFLAAAREGTAALPGTDCLVIGGGNTAMDVARVARRLGAAVTVCYRRTVDEMPAIREEYERAVEDGVEFRWLSLPRRVERRQGRLSVTVEEMRLGEPDASGRRRPEPTGVMATLTVDAVFAAVGETADMGPIPERLAAASGWLEVGEAGTTPDPAVLAGGDLTTGPATVVAAIAAGREAARAIDERLGFGDRWPPTPPRDAVVGPADVHVATRIVTRRGDDTRSGDPDPFAEETVSMVAAAARAELERCLSCGTCNECGTCFVFCPDGAIRWEAGPIIDLEFCKGCGICVTECPGHHLVLVNERELADA